MPFPSGTLVVGCRMGNGRITCRKNLFVKLRSSKHDCLVSVCDSKLFKAFTYLLLLLCVHVYFTQEHILKMKYFISWHLLTVDLTIFVVCYYKRCIALVQGNFKWQPNWWWWFYLKGLFVCFGTAHLTNTSETAFRLL